MTVLKVVLSIVGIILLIGCFIGLIAVIRNNTLAKKDGDYERINPLFPVIGMIVGAAIIFAMGSFVVVPTGNTGVIVTFGQVNDKTLSSGLNFKIPFIQQVELVNNKQQDVVYDGQIWSETKNLTEVYYEGITATCSINADKSAWLYANVTNTENLLSATLIQSAIKSASKTLDDENATNRGTLEPLTQEFLQDAVNDKYGEGAITIYKVSVSNANFTDEYNKAISENRNADLAYKTAQIENKKAIEKAQADAEVARTNAQAKADAELIQAKATAESNKLLQESITSAILQDKYIEKWNGKLPQVQLSDDSSVMLDVSQVTEETDTE